MSEPEARLQRIEAERINVARDDFRSQWRAWRGDEDDLTRYGHGLTEQDAIDDLLEMET